MSRLLVWWMAALPALAQSTVDARPGRITYTEGVLYADGRAKTNKDGLPLEWRDLRTGVDSRAEFSLGPCVVAHLDAASSVRLLPDGLELLAGTAIVHADGPTTVLVGGISTAVRASGVYRFRTDPPEVAVRIGKATVLRGGGRTVVRAGRALALDSDARPAKSPPADDAFERFSARRILTIWAESGLREKELRERRLRSAQPPPDADPNGRGSPSGLPGTWTTPERPHVCPAGGRW